MAPVIVTSSDTSPASTHRCTSRTNATFQPRWNCSRCAATGAMSKAVVIAEATSR
jgi:hypothetical protein